MVVMKTGKKKAGMKASNKPEVINISKTKSKLIQELLCSEKKRLNLNQTEAPDLCPGSEINEKIKQLVEQKEADIFPNPELESIGTPPANVLEAVTNLKNQQKQQLKLQSASFAAIPKHKLKKFLALLSTNKTVSKYEKELNLCLPHLRSESKPYWASPCVILKAINDSILRRKWDNLTELLLMLLQLPQYRYAPIIRYICRFMTRLHPALQENRSLQDQFRVFQQAYKRGP